MNFEPEKVERFFAQTGIAEFDEDSCVSSSDYDQLLALYRELPIKITGLMNQERYTDIWKLLHSLAPGSKTTGS